MKTTRNPILRTNQRNRGFTLAEALCTIVVLVAILPALVEGFTIAGKVASRTRQRAEATALAQSIMDEMVSTGEWQNGTTNGTDQSSKTGLEYEYEVSLSDWSEADTQQLNDLEQMDVTVHWHFEGIQEEVVLSTVVYIPESTITTGATGTGVGGGGGMP
jgi:type II secretory pathway pseudopilin PulG